MLNLSLIIRKVLKMVRDTLGRFRRQRPISWPLGSNKLFFQRTTDRYGRKGTFAHNPGYMRVKRDGESGRFVAIR